MYGQGVRGGGAPRSSIEILVTRVNINNHGSSFSIKKYQDVAGELEGAPASKSVQKPSCLALKIVIQPMSVLGPHGRTKLGTAVYKCLDVTLKKTLTTIKNG